MSTGGVHEGTEVLCPRPQEGDSSGHGLSVSPTVGHTWVVSQTQPPFLVGLAPHLG